MDARGSSGLGVPDARLSDKHLARVAVCVPCPLLNSILPEFYCLQIRELRGIAGPWQMFH